MKITLAMSTQLAAALARLRRGIKERPSAAKRRAALRNLAAARLKRWPPRARKKPTTGENEK